LNLTPTKRWTIFAPMQPFTLMPFTAQFAAEWKEGCGNGELKLAKAR